MNAGWKWKNLCKRKYQIPKAIKIATVNISHRLLFQVLHLLRVRLPCQLKPYPLLKASTGLAGQTNTFSVRFFLRMECLHFQARHPERGHSMDLA